MILRSVDELEPLLARERAAKKICAELNNFIDLRSVLKTILTAIKDLSSCEAVGVRLHHDGDYPYYVYNGFPETFIERENTLCSRDNEGNRIESPETGEWLLDCMCGNIICGCFDPALPFFTEGGSFWSNHTTALLEGTTEEDRQGRTRNYCNSCGYESVALIPIRIQGERIGLIQLNDHRKGMFTKSFIEFMEMIGEHIGLAVRNATIYTKLKEAHDEIKILRGILPICISCKKIRDDQGYWTQLENYIREHSEAEFTHGICPACEEKLYPGLRERLVVKWPES